MNRVLKQLLDMCRESGDVPYIEGESGIGKSQMIEQYAKENGMKCTVLMLSQNEVGDLIGIPNLTPDGRTTWGVPTWFGEILDDAKDGINHILFIDEINRGSQDVKASIFDVVLKGKLHTHQLPKGTMIVAAANPNNGKYQVTVNDPALMNRFLYINLTVDVDGWLSWAKSQNLHPAVIQFISKHPEYLLRQVGAGNVNGSKMVGQHATPRSWYMAAQNTKVLEKMNVDDDILRTMLIGKVGIEIGGLFYTFYKESTKLFSVQDTINFVEKHKDTMKTTSIKAYQESLDKLGELMKKEIENVEHPQLQLVAEKLVDSYTNEDGSAIFSMEELQKVENKMKILPLTALLYAMPLELAAATIRQYKSENKRYHLLWNGDNEGTLTRRIMAVKENNENWVK